MNTCYNPDDYSPELDAYTPEQEREDARWSDHMSQGQWMTAAVAQWAGVAGREDPSAEWVLSPYDTWERNPFFTGVSSGRHPEDRDDLLTDQDAYAADMAADAAARGWDLRPYNTPEDEERARLNAELDAFDDIDF